MIYIDRYWKEIFHPTIACDAPLPRTNQVKPTVSFGVPFNIQSAVCLTTGLQPIPKWDLRTVWSSASSFIFQYPLFSLCTSSSCLRLLPRLPLTFILFTTFSFKRLILGKMWLIQLAYLLFTFCRIFLYSLNSSLYFSISHTIGPTDLFLPSPGPHFKTFWVFRLLSTR